jgi:hypothetical protein
MMTEAKFLRPLAVEAAHVFCMICARIAKVEDISPQEAANQAMTWAAELTKETLAVTA